MRCRTVAVVLAALGCTALGLGAPASAATSTTSSSGRSPVIVTGPGRGVAPHVRTFDRDAAGVASFYAFAPASASGAHVATGDVNGDGVDEIIAASGPGSPSAVTVRTIDGADSMGSFSPYGDFQGGVNIAAGDVDGDGRDEIVTAADAGGGPHVRVWDVNGPGQFVEKFGFLAYDPGFRGGVSVAVANVVGSSQADIITGAGAGGGPHVRVWDASSGAPRSIAGFFAYDAGFRGGVRVGAGNLNGSPAVVTGAGPGGGPHVRVFTPSGSPIAGFFAYAPSFAGGVAVAVGDVDGDGRPDIVTGAGAGGGPHVRTFDASGTPHALQFFAYAPDMTAGVNVAVFRHNGNSSTQNGGTTTSSASMDPTR